MTRASRSRPLTIATDQKPPQSSMARPAAVADIDPARRKARQGCFVDNTDRFVLAFRLSEESIPGDCSDPFDYGSLGKEPVFIKDKLTHNPDAFDFDLMDDDQNLRVSSAITRFLSDLGLEERADRALGASLKAWVRWATDCSEDVFDLKASTGALFGVGIQRAAPNELPSLPKGLSWPVEKYSGSPESKRGGGGIVAFLSRVWIDVLQGAPGVIDLRTLRLADRSAAKGIDNLTQKTDPLTGERLKLPKHIDIPTKPQVTDREAKLYPVSSERPARLDRTLRSRAWRASKGIG